MRSVDRTESGKRRRAAATGHRRRPTAADARPCVTVDTDGIEPLPIRENQVLNRLTDDMKAAMKAGDKQRLGVIRMLISELKNARIAAGADLDDAAVNRVLGSYAKKRREAMEAARDAGREEHAVRERFELDVTAEYLPPQLDESALREIVARHVEAVEPGPAAFGKVMKAALAELEGRADGKTVSAMVREMLGT